MSFLEERDLLRRGREAREWLFHDERGRVIGLVVFSVAISIVMSLMATAIVGFVSRRRAAAPVGAVSPNVGEPLAEVAAAPAEAVASSAEADAVPVRGTDASITEDEPAQAAGA